jgi:hypothetical protein
MSRAILHIGLHKTGTTLIQNTFAANRDLLAQHGVIYPEIGRATGHHSLLRRWLQLDEHYATPTPPQALWLDLGRHARPDTTLVLSSEEFSRANRRVDLAEIRAYLAPFDRVEVVCFLRDQPGFVQSIHLELGKKHAAPNFTALLDEAHKTGLAAGLHVDYGGLYDWLLTAFAPDEIHFIDHAQARAGEGGILGAMLRLCGSDLPVSALKAPEGPEAEVANISPDPLAAWAAGLVAAPAPAPPALIAVARATLDTQFGAGWPSMVYTRGEYRKLAAHVAPLNHAFVARVQKVQPGFTLSPPRPAPADLAPPGARIKPGEDPTGRIWREDLGPWFWARFAARLYQGEGRPAGDAPG